MTMITEQINSQTRSAEALSVLKKVFGYDSFRGQQAEVVDHVTGGGDAFVLMPTGAGKSLCFQIPALLRSGVTIVVSPLIALMEDQVGALRENGVRAAMLNSSQTPAEQAKVQADIESGRLDLVYMAPERLVTSGTLQLLARVPVSLFAIDEAHCVSAWGHDFRPEYLGLSLLNDQFPHVPRVALTATADQRTQAEIVERLNLHDARVFIAGFDRPNIKYQVVPRDNGKRQLLKFIEEEHSGQSGIVYCLSRKRTEETAAWLTEAGYDALPYHAGMDASARRRNQEKFLREDGLIMVATVAFGMGIDKPNVRFVAHLDLPKSIEAYYQETGRAGRDGLPSDAWMLFGMGDAVTQRRFIDDSEADEAHKRIERGKLNALVGLCETTACRRRVLLAYFGQDSPETCGNCDACLSPAELWDGSLVARKALYVIGATGQRFGAQHLIDVLRGKDSDKVRQFGHDSLSAFGKGGELSDREWHSVMRQLISHGMIHVDLERYGSFKLTESGAGVLREKSLIHLRRDTRPARKTRETRQASERTGAGAMSGHQQRLFDALRAKRREIAQEHSVPPYVIFHDATLNAIAQAEPTTLSELRGISGVGERKLEAYGRMILEVITECQIESER